ncbi:hypothetical protein BST36_30930, partial [Mycolicibacterium moriokaense]
AVNGTAAVIVGLPLGLALVVGLIYVWVSLAFAPPLIVLERLGTDPAVGVEQHGDTRAERGGDDLRDDTTHGQQDECQQR